MWPNISESQPATDIVNMKFDIVIEERVFIETTRRNGIEIVVAGKCMSSPYCPGQNRNLDVLHPADCQRGGCGAITHSFGQRPALNACHVFMRFPFSSLSFDLCANRDIGAETSILYRERNAM
jgi:hypothetical protein